MNSNTSSFEVVFVLVVASSPCPRSGDVVDEDKDDASNAGVSVAAAADGSAAARTRSATSTVVSVKYVDVDEPSIAVVDREVRERARKKRKRKKAEADIEVPVPLLLVERTCGELCRFRSLRLGRSSSSSIQVRVGLVHRVPLFRPSTALPQRFSHTYDATQERCYTTLVAEYSRVKRAKWMPRER